MKITKRDLLRLYNSITLIEGRRFTVKFSYFIAKNKVGMRDEITALDRARKMSTEFAAYDKERISLARKLADKNDDGSSIIQDSSFLITKKIDSFQEELSHIRKKYADAISDREKQITEFEELLDGTVEYEGTKVKFKHIPDNIESSVLETFVFADLIIDED